MSRQKLIPDLRFPEFKNEGEWEESELGNFCFNISSGKDKNYEGGEFELYGSTGIIGKSKNSSYNGDYILVARVGANAGLLNRAKGKFGVTDNTLVLDLKKNGSIDFIFFSLKKIGLNQLVFGSGQPLITGSQLKRLQLLIPGSEDEQQKIASFFSSLDDVIEAQNKKLDLLKDHKKGLMQNLFPQEGKKVPNYRFTEFKNDGEWEEKNLGEIGEIITGSTPSTNERAYYNGKIMFVSPIDINDYRYITQTKTTLTELGFSKTRHIKTNSVLFVCIGSTIGKIAQNTFECATNQQINSVVPYKDYLSDFLYSLLENDVSKISVLAGNQAVPIINKTLFSSVKLFFPPTKAEQQKIASCLSSLDEVIEAQTQKIEQLKQHKKGLMQGLFPKIDN